MGHLPDSNAIHLLERKNTHFPLVLHMSDSKENLIMRK